MKKILICGLMLLIGSIMSSTSYSADAVTGQTVKGTISTRPWVDGVGYVDPRNIRALNSNDIVTVNSGTITITNTSFTINTGTVSALLKDSSGSTITFDAGRLPVVSGEESGTARKIADQRSITAGATVEVGTFAVTAGKTFYIDTLCLSSADEATVVLYIDGASTEIAVRTSPSQQTAVYPLYQSYTVAGGKVVSLRVTNRGVTTDVSAFLGGKER